MHTFTYHAVGQGLFFSANFFLDNKKKFLMVYDCGADKKNKKNLISSVDNFVRKNQHIDMLIVSHFDYDHISGIQLLLSKCTVSQIVLPYLSNQEILMYVLQQNQTPDTQLNWYLDFLRDPFSFLLEYQTIDEILVVFPSELDNKSIWISNLDANIDNLKSEKEIGLGNKIKGIIDSNYYTIESHLRLRFFNYPITKQKEQAFFRKVIDEMSNNNDSTLNAMSERILRDIQLTLDFKRRYEAVNKSNHNNVSLLLMYSYTPPLRLSTAEISTESIQQLNFFDDQISTSSCIQNPVTINHLLTGDISINYKYKQRKIYNHYKDLLPEIDYIQIPHHGSKHNWNNDIMYEIPKDTAFIVSHGIKNSFKHPHKEVVKSIESSSFKIYYANQDNFIYGSFT